MKILFVYHHPQPDYWKDGLFQALELLKQEHTITMLNLYTRPALAITDENRPDFILGWGGFTSPVDTFLQTTVLWNNVPKGLCVGGNVIPLTNQNYDVLYYETEWVKQWIISTNKGRLPNLIHAFGYNSTIFTPASENRVIDYLTVGAFASWKRQEKLLDKSGLRVAIGQIQKGNLAESMGILAPLLMDGVMVSDTLAPEQLANIYRLTKTVYIPADVQGGGERAVLEAQGCGCQVEIESDNPKLKELLGKKWDEQYYKEQLENGFT